MPAPQTVPDRFYRTLHDVAARLGVTPPDLAGRFGLRRYVERAASGDTELQANHWVQHAARLRKDARGVSFALNDARVRHFFFKGIALVGRFYQLEDRRLADIDLMVDPVHRNRALAALHAQGYVEMTRHGKPGPESLRPGVTMYRIDPVTGEPDMETLLDVHWGLEPLTRLLPEDWLDVPAAVWSGVETHRGLPAPSDEHHLALVLHHLVRHDLLHVRGLLDIAFLWEGIPKRGGAELSELAGRLGVRRALGVVGRVIVDELRGFPLRGVRLGGTDWRDRRVLERLRLGEWLTWAARHARESQRHVTLTAERAWRRYLLADDGGTGRRLMGELVRPPDEYLRWRWPDAPSGTAALRRHLHAVGAGLRGH